MVGKIVYMCTCEHFMKSRQKKCTYSGYPDKRMFQQISIKRSVIMSLWFLLVIVFVIMVIPNEVT
jgi:hypothetical protein